MAESELGFMETTTNVDENCILVPWLSWDEWDFVRRNLFSSSPDSVATALRRIEAWRSRGCLPVQVEVTALIIRTQQNDPNFRKDLTDATSYPDVILSNLYSVAIIRLVNGVIEKTRKKEELSIAVAAAKIGIRRTLIDLRHEGSHREIPSLGALRGASNMALNWLKSKYWTPQKNKIPYQSGKATNVRKEIRSRLQELAFILKAKRHSASGASDKRAKHHEQLIGAMTHGRNKFFSLMAVKSHSSKYIGSKKKLMRNLRNLARLYSFFSSDVVSVLLEFLLKAPNSTDTMDSPDNFQINLSIEVAQAAFDEWKPVIVKFGQEEPELLVSLLKAVLDMIESRRAIRDDFGGVHFSLLQYDLETHRIGVLSSVFTWLLLSLKALKPPHEEDQVSQIEPTSTIPKSVLIELTRRCLYISDPENHELLGSALLLGKMAGCCHVSEKFHKLSLVTSLYSKATTEDNPSGVTAEDLTCQDKQLRLAAEKLESLKKLGKGTKASTSSTQNENVENDSIWTVVKSWNPCPIGMLPRSVGSSGYLPVLDLDFDHKREVRSSSIDNEEHPDLRHSDKREQSCHIEMMDNPSVEKVREAENFGSFEPDDDVNVNHSSDLVKGELLIDGVWQQVGDQKLPGIKSRVGVLVTKRKR